MEFLNLETDIQPILIEKVFEKNKKRGKYVKLSEKKKKILKVHFQKIPYPTSVQYQKLAEEISEPMFKIQNWFKHQRYLQLENEKIKQQYKKRKIFNPTEEKCLKDSFKKNSNPSLEEKLKIADLLNLKPKAVTNWFFYRRKKLLKMHGNKIKKVPKRSMNTRNLKKKKNEVIAKNETTILHINSEEQRIFPSEECELKEENLQINGELENQIKNETIINTNEQTNNNINSNSNHYNPFSNNYLMNNFHFNQSLLTSNYHQRYQYFNSMSFYNGLFLYQQYLNSLQQINRFFNNNENNDSENVQDYTFNLI